MPKADERWIVRTLKFKYLLNEIQKIGALPEDHAEEFEAETIPGNASAGKRTIPFSREVWIERADFMEDPPRKFFRLGPGREVKLRYGYCITCDEVIYDDQGEVVELRCSHDPETQHGLPKDRKVKGFLHWVSVRDAEQADVQIPGHLFQSENPEEEGDFLPSFFFLSRCNLVPLANIGYICFMLLASCSCGCGRCCD